MRHPAAAAAAHGTPGLAGATARSALLLVLLPLLLSHLAATARGQTIINDFFDNKMYGPDPGPCPNENDKCTANWDQVPSWAKTAVIGASASCQTPNAKPTHPPPE